ncbi:BioY family transporter [Pontibacillus yanchengensis]|uniref:BioY family transporter n=2 Tax=Pontibacillus yanchengensis TaxID=462910 RepID=A0ACC7VKI9_9BACI|nr:biotin transporter BioY [Pontibacillus yanchengensis]MYL35010.1 BioY family transporter [Pontibacillus yanchengensis]MYL55278.1 BioY family transporter [Pontibacillus yanchengensis]
MKKAKWSALDLTMGGLFVAMMAVGANITSIAPFMVIGGVPITLQTFFAILAGVLLGSRLGAFSMLTYMLLGLAGAPIFAQFKGGAATLLTPTFGFIVSFILIAYIAGKLVEMKRSFPMYITAALVAMVINYVFGTNWMYAAYVLWFDAPEGFTYQMAWAWMLVPIPKDIVLSIMAGVLGQRIEIGVLSKSKFRKQNQAA